MSSQPGNRPPDGSSPSHDELYDEVARRHPQYPRAAYVFVGTAVHEIAVKILKHHSDSDEKSNRSRHITGQELVLGLKDLLLKRYGRLAIDVLRHWHISETLDFGKIVYFLVEVQLLSVSPEDSFEDFRDVYSFSDVFSPTPGSRRVRKPLPVIDFFSK